MVVELPLGLGRRLRPTLRVNRPLGLRIVTWESPLVFKLHSLSIWLLVSTPNISVNTHIAVCYLGHEVREDEGFLNQDLGPTSILQVCWLPVHLPYIRLLIDSDWMRLHSSSVGWNRVVERHLADRQPVCHSLHFFSWGDWPIEVAEFRHFGEPVFWEFTRVSHAENGRFFQVDMVIGRKRLIERLGFNGVHSTRPIKPWPMIEYFPRFLIDVGVINSSAQKIYVVL